MTVSDSVSQEELVFPISQYDPPKIVGQVFYIKLSLRRAEERQHYECPTCAAFEIALLRRSIFNLISCLEVA